MRIMILGSTGMAGHIVFDQLNKRSDLEIINVSFRNKLNSDTILFDFYRKDQISDFLTEYKPDIIINCIGVLIKEANENPEKAIYVNAFLPHFLSKISRDIKCRLIHLSTDCVFSGKKGMYNAEDSKDAQDFYGMSKALGEVINDIDLTIRTSIIGPELKKEGQGLLHWFLNQSGVIKGFTEAYWSGITTLQLAKIIEQAIDAHLTGLFQYSNGLKISKFQLLSIFNKVWEKENLFIQPIPGKKVDKSLVTSCSPFINPAPGYHEMCSELADYMKSNKKNYKQYK